MDEYYNAIERLPQPFRSALMQLPTFMAQQVHEIRIRSGRPIVFSTPNGQVLAENLISKTQQAHLYTNHEQLQECFYGLCERSVYIYEKQLIQGFFTLPGGHRVGVAGSFHKTKENLLGIQTITSLNIRIARAIFQPLPQELSSHLDTGFRGMIIAGAPGSGKTTFLRSILKELSNRGLKTVVIDERSELLPCGSWGVPCHTPLHCDILTGCEKVYGMQIAIRSLGPQVIVCDELGSQNELICLEQGRHSGVEFLCSVHAYNLEDIELRFNKSRLELKQLFSCCIFLKSAQQAGQIKELLWL